MSAGAVYEPRSVVGRRRVIYAVLFLLGCAYLVQIQSPLRLNTDAMTYLSIAASAEDGQGFVDGTRDTRFPAAYPSMILLTAWLGIASSATFILLNVFFIGLALLFTSLIAVRYFNLSSDATAACCGIVLLSFVIVKHVTLPLAESVFTASVMAALILLATADREVRPTQKWLLVAASLAVILLSIQVRTVGIALIPALIFVSARPIWSSVSQRDDRLVIGSIVGGVLLLTAGATAFMVMQSVYFEDLMYFVRYESLAAVAWRNIQWKMLEWGEMVANVPAGRVPGDSRLPLMLIGLAGMAAVLAGLVRRRMVGPVEVFSLSYAAIIFIWPGYDARFWMPLIPLIVLYIAVLIVHAKKQKLVHIAAIVYVCWFTFTGFAALGYSTTISLSGSQFPYRYGDGTLTSTYLLAYEGVDDGGEVNARALRILRRFEPRLHPAARTSAPAGEDEGQHQTRQR